jgi:hypothetical protein
MSTRLWIRYRSQSALNVVLVIAGLRLAAIPLVWGASPCWWSLGQ